MNGHADFFSAPACQKEEASKWRARIVRSCIKLPASNECRPVVFTPSAATASTSNWRIECLSSPSPFLFHESFISRARAVCWSSEPHSNEFDEWLIKLPTALRLLGSGPWTGWQAADPVATGNQEIRFLSGGRLSSAKKKRTAD